MVKEVKNQKSKVKIASKNSKVKAETKETKKITKKVTKLEAAVPVETKTASKKAAKSVKAEVYDVKGKVVETMDLPGDVFGAKINEKLLAVAVRVYLANQRRGTVSTKSRGEVKGSSRKIYKQKGTGRARHGSLRAPIFVHGGVAFGPTPRDFSLKLSKKMRKAALFAALSSKIKNDKIKIISGLEKISPKTKEMANVIKNLDLSKKKTLLVLPKREENIDRAARNLENVDIALASSLNAYSVLQAT
ncbi:MAG: 50S ribosomal protein L4, partial [Patescibacteria group bacterium]|nr:50S ribosomal protein L4 [Patescibacteria group bacterium]